VISEQQPWSATGPDCIRCNDAPAVDEDGYCGHCHWTVKAEFRVGLMDMQEYLLAWARFAEWCHARGQTAH
jgi:hypothetical protein